MKTNGKKLLVLFSLFTLTIASIFAAVGEESRPFQLNIYGTLSDSEPEINIKYNSAYLEDNQIISTFDFGNPDKQITEEFSIAVGSYDLTEAKTLNFEISATPFYLFDDDGTTVLVTGESPNITIFEDAKYPLTQGEPYTSSDKAFSFVLPSGYYKLSEYLFADFTFDVTPGTRNYMAGSYQSTVTFSFSVN